MSTPHFNPQSQAYPRCHQGPPLLLMALIYIALVIAGIVSGLMMAPPSAFPLPFEPVEKAVRYVAQYGGAIRWGSFFEFASAIPLGIFTATVVSLLRFHRVRAAGVWIAWFGGTSASILLMVSALAGWALSTPGIAQSAGGVRALQLLSFAAGGPGFAVPLGLLLAGVSIPSGFYRLLPKWLVWLGVVIAVAAELSTFTLLTWRAAMFIPVARFVSFVWLIGVAAKMPAIARGGSSASVEG